MQGSMAHMFINLDPHELNELQGKLSIGTNPNQLEWSAKLTLQMRILLF